MTSDHASFIAVIALGDFGAAVLQELERSDDRVMKNSAAHILSEGIPPSAKSLVMVAPNLAFSLVSDLELIARERGLPLIALMVESEGLFLAHFSPGLAGACPVCLERRSIQAAREVYAKLVLQDFYRDNPQEGPEGWLYPFVSLGSEWLLSTCLSRPGALPAGDTRRLNFASGKLSRESTLPASHCPRCKPELLFQKQLSSELNSLWSNGPIRPGDE